MLIKPFFILTLLSYGRNEASSQDLPSDPGSSGPAVEIVHVYNDEWPTGITVSAKGRMFSNYPPALDPNNVKYTVAELKGNDSETPYPSAEINSPPGGRINYTTTPPTGANYQDYLIGVQSVVVDSTDYLWILDTGRASTENGTMVPATYGGPKLVGVDLATDRVFKTIVFEPSVAPADSYLNDLRIDLNPSLTPSGDGVIYITDSSPEGRNAIVTVDIGAGEAWRHLDGHPSVRPSSGFVPIIWGEPVYINGSADNPITSINFGSDGITLSADGSTLYYSTTGGRELYSIPTARLRDRGPYSELLAQGSVQFLGQKGFSDGLESDSNDNIYCGSLETNSITIFSPKTGTTSTFVRDARFSWIDTMAAASDGYLYIVENQLWLRPVHWGGIDRRSKPLASLMRVKLPNEGKKIGS